MRKFLSLTLVLALSVMAVAQGQRRTTSQPQSFDVIIRGGTVYDGTGRAPLKADVGINGDRIAAVGNLSRAIARTTVDARGLAVAPGFINMLSHSESSHQFAVGVSHVFVNGVQVLKDGQHTAAKPGRALWGPGKLKFDQSNAAGQAKPLPAPARWRGLIGEYGPDNDIFYILEKDGRLCALFKRVEFEPLEEVSKNVFEFPENGPRAGRQLVFTRDLNGRATQVEVENAVFKRRQVGPEEGAPQLHITPVRPVKELLRAALAAEPPKENGDFRQPDLIELSKLDPTIKLDIRYATTNNFLGTVFYSEPRAFMQRPAAEALVRAHRKLSTQGYGLLVHDAYRPWYVTKVFWDATPNDKKIFVADPSKGSRHNRGCAVDVTLYDLKTGKPVEMVSTYDETTDRAYPDYPGGTSLQRWHRKLLRDAMESEGFTVYEAEWWHFDYQDWQKYPIINVPFEKIASSFVFHFPFDISHSQIQFQSDLNRFQNKAPN